MVPPAYFQIAVNTIFLHGGVGFTCEHDGHRYYKNALSNEVLLGDSNAQLDRLADLLGL